MHDMCFEFDFVNSFLTVKKINAIFNQCFVYKTHFECDIFICLSQVKAYNFSLYCIDPFLCSQT